MPLKASYFQFFQLPTSNLQLFQLLTFNFSSFQLPTFSASQLLSKFGIHIIKPFAVSQLRGGVRPEVCYFRGQTYNPYKYYSYSIFFGLNRASRTLSRLNRQDMKFRISARSLAGRGAIGGTPTWRRSSATTIWVIPHWENYLNCSTL